MAKQMKSTQALAAAGLGAWVALAGSASADIQHLDDVIIDLSLCVGQDCVNGESFGFDTVRLKENNLRIHFQDTSNSASFPTADWRIVINDSGNGGANYFAIEDSGVARQPFRIEAGAPASSLYVDDGGRIGLGTSTPVVEAHIVDGDTPTLRLEQDGSSGFTPQTFDLAANESNFFIRDVTNGGRLVFRAVPGAPQNSLFIAASGNIGLGTNAPDLKLDVRGSGIFQGGDGTTSLSITETSTTDALRALMIMSNTGNLFYRMDNTNSSDYWDFAVADGLRSYSINANGGASELRLDTDGDLFLTGTITTAGSCSTPCDAVFADDYDILPISARAEMMYDLGYLPNVGPTAEQGQYDLTQKVLGMLNELEHAHIYISQLNQRIETLEAALVQQAD